MVEPLGIIIVSMIAVSCYTPHIRRCIRCGADDSCPEGLSCNRGYCEAPTMTCSVPEAGADALISDAANDLGREQHLDGSADLPVDALVDGHTDGADASVDGAGDARLDAGNPPSGCSSYHTWNIVRQKCLPAGDLNGDGLADLLAINGTDMQALISDGSSFGKEQWLDGAFYGPAGQAFAADVTGSGFASGILLAGDHVAVMHRAGPGFGDTADNQATWLMQGFLGTRATFLADVDGNGTVDLLAVNDGDVQVALSTGFDFALPRAWITGNFAAYDELFAADVDGDGAADLVALDASSVDVFVSTGAGLANAAQWGATPSLGELGSFVADVDGDGRADRIRVESNGAWVCLSTGKAFSDEVLWFAGPIAGEVTSFLMDADGDGRADFVALNKSNVQVSLSTGTAFSPASIWYEDGFLGEESTTVAPAPSSSCGTLR